MRTAVAAAALAALATVAAGPPSAPPRQPPHAAAIYSPDAADSWNRIFAALFTRTVRTRVTGEHRDAGPFEERPLAGFDRRLRISRRTFDREEPGDRAIDPLYPSFLTRDGVDAVLTEPRRTLLLRALDDALQESTARAPLARALMQADLWPAFDALSAIGDTMRENERKASAAALLPRLARLIARVALAQSEIDGLPDNFAGARAAGRVPDLFASAGPWMEIEWGKHRLHDGLDGVVWRQAARVFVRPAASAPADDAFLRILTRPSITQPVAGVALLMQRLLVDREMRVRPTRLISEVQVRTFVRDPAGAVSRTSFEQFELSRRAILHAGEAGGFLRFDGGAAAYLPVSGNDYGFASPEFGSPGPRLPVLGTLRTRCSFCHGPDGAQLVTLSVQSPESMPPMVRFPQPNDVRARYIAGEKERRPEFARLKALAGRQ